MSDVCVRFAPSPTGRLHIGNLRVALFNWLFAARFGGRYFIRMEDTDVARSTKEFAQEILFDLSWAQASSSFDTIYQSDRIVLYQAAIDRLIELDKAYKCFCPPSQDPERVERDYLKYDGRCRSMLKSEQPNRAYVVRFKFPLERKKITFHDEIYGAITVEADQLDDFILARSDGTPVYNLAVVVDDAAMGITHVIRGQDHISNTPKQLLLYEALDYKIPKFGHVPLILGSSGQPLSKRDAATAVRDYRLNGYVPSALCNYLMRLGWSHGDQEIFNRRELIRLFDLDGVGKSSATFDVHKLDWLNEEYIKLMNGQELFDYIICYIDPLFDKQLKNWSMITCIKALELYKLRVKTLKELCLVCIRLHNEISYDTIEDIGCDQVQAVREIYSLMTQEGFVLEQFSVDNIKQVARMFDIALPKVMKALRFALSGFQEGPSVLALMDTLGFNISLTRISAFLKTYDLCLK